MRDLQTDFNHDQPYVEVLRLFHILFVVIYMLWLKAVIPFFKFCYKIDDTLDIYKAVSGSNMPFTLRI